MTLTHAMHLDPLIAIFLAAAGFGIVFIGYHLYEIGVIYWRGYRARKELSGAESLGDPGSPRPRLVPKTAPVERPQVVYPLSSVARRVASARDSEAGRAFQGHSHARGERLDQNSDCYGTATSLTLGPKDGAA